MRETIARTIAHRETEIFQKRNRGKKWISFIVSLFIDQPWERLKGLRAKLRYVVCKWNLCLYLNVLLSIGLACCRLLSYMEIEKRSCILLPYISRLSCNPEQKHWLLRSSIRVFFKKNIPMIFVWCVCRPDNRRCQKVRYESWCQRWRFEKERDAIFVELIKR